MKVSIEELNQLHKEHPHLILWNDEGTPCQIAENWLKTTNRPHAYSGRWYYNLSPQKHTENELHALLTGAELRALHFAHDHRDVDRLAKAQDDRESVSILSADGESYYYVVNGRLDCGRNSEPLSRERWESHKYTSFYGVTFDEAAMTVAKVS